MWGLALSGGGVLGAAHLGVLQALDEWDVRPDVVVGASAGGLVAGALASGLGVTAQVYAFRGIAARPSVFFGPVPIVAGIASLLEPSPAPGLLSLAAMLSQVLAVASRPAVRDWPAGYAVVATRLPDGATVRISAAETPDWTALEALQATAAFPGLFAPVRRGKDIYADGGLVDDSPADIARALGCERVLLVDLSRPVPPPAERIWIDALLRMAFEAAVARAQPPLPPGVLRLRPEVPSVSLLDFRAFEPALEAGYQAACAAKAEILAMAAGGDPA